MACSLGWGAPAVPQRGHTAARRSVSWPPSLSRSGALWDSPLVTQVPSRLSPAWAVLDPSVPCSWDGRSPVSTEVVAPPRPAGARPQGHKGRTPGVKEAGARGFAGHFYRGPRERHAGLAGQVGPSCLCPAVTRGFSRGLDGHGQLCGRTAAEGGSSPRRALSVGGPKRLAERPQPACGGRLGNLAARRQRAGGTHPRAAGPDHGRGGTVSVLGD